MLGADFDDALARARQGDVSAFTELWRDTHPMLLRYLRVSTGPEAEDIASQTWLKVIEGIGTFSGPEPAFRRWVVVIARNLAVDGMRRAGRRPQEPLDDSSDNGWAATVPDTADLVVEQLSTDAALRLIGSLPRHQAEMIMLRVVMGLDYAVVAEIVGRSPGAVRVAVHRGLLRLRNAVAPQVAVTDRRRGAFPDGHV